MDRQPEAKRPSPFFEEWAREYAWSERARAHDAYIERIRRRGMEEAIEEEAAEQAPQAERTRNHLNELMAPSYMKAIEYLEELDASTMRLSDVVQISRVHIETIDKLGSADEGRREDDWTEEDDAEFDIIEEIDELEDAADEPDEGEDDSESVDDDTR